MNIAGMSVEEIREKLVEYGYSRDDVKNIKGKSQLALVLKQEMDANVPSLGMAEPILNSVQVVVEEEPAGELSEPAMYSPEWHNYVMSLLRPDELIDGAPKCDGLRRLANKLLGEIIFSAPTQVFPADQNGRATVVYTVKVAWKRDVPEYINLDKFEYPVREFADVSDCSPENSVKLYAKHASATASTRAEGRALRKALGLNICTAEELNKEDKDNKYGDNTIDTNMMSTKISLAQKNFITVKCAQLKIDPYKFMNITHFVHGGPLKFKTLDEVDNEVAIKMIEELNKFQSNSNDSKESRDIPEQIKVV